MPVPCSVLFVRHVLPNYAATHYKKNKKSRKIHLLQQMACPFAARACGKPQLSQRAGSRSQLFSDVMIAGKSVRFSSVMK